MFLFPSRTNFLELWRRTPCSDWGGATLWWYYRGLCEGEGSQSGACKLGASWTWQMYGAHSHFNARRKNKRCHRSRRPRDLVGTMLSVLLRLLPPSTLPDRTLWFINAASHLGRTKYPFHNVANNIKTPTVEVGVKTFLWKRQYIQRYEKAAVQKPVCFLFVYN